MPLWPKLASFFRTLTRGRRLDADLHDELRAFVDAQIERKIAAGMHPGAARRSALLEVGGVEQVKEQVRDVRVGRLVEETMRDVAYAWRMLIKAPGFSVAAIATLALGVGANTAIFSIVNALLIEPLPYRDSSRLVFVWADQTSEGYPRAPLSGPELKDLDDRTSLFEGFGAIWATTAALTGEGEPQQLRIGHVSTDFFALLGADAALGRTFAGADDSLAAPTTILLSSAIWQRRYGGDPNIVGSRILVNGQPTTVVGVMPASFRLLMPPDAAVPDDLEAWQPFNRRYTEGNRGQRYLRVVGRMKTGVALKDAQSDIARVGREISREFTQYGAAGRQFETVALQADSVREVRGPLIAMFAAVGILLAIACVNVASLLIARAAARARETAMRVALGAGYGRLIRQHLVEGLLLSVLGAIAGVLAGRWSLDALLALAPDSLSRLEAARINGTVLVFTIGTVFVFGVLLSMAPLSEVLRLTVAQAIRIDASRTGHAGHSLRSALIAGQLAMSVVLVVGALLLVRTFVNIQNIKPGFEADGIYSFRLAARAPTREAANEFARNLQAKLAAIPGATAASSISHAPYDHVPNWGGPYRADGIDLETVPQADYRSLAPVALELMGIRLVEGRSFTEDDDLTSQPVVIVDNRLASRMWPGQSAVGRRLSVDPFVRGKPEVWSTVVAVVEHVRHRSPVEDVREQVYFPQRQVVRNPSVYVVKAGMDPAALVPSIRDVVRELDPSLPIYDVRPLSAYVEGARATRGFTMQLAIVFALLALALASVGIYGVIAYSVTLRRREFGVRRALGARAGQVVALVAREGARLVGRGVAAGVIGAAVATWFLRSQLFGVGPWDAWVYAASIPVLLAAATAACLVPALKASAANPADALRSE